MRPLLDRIGDPFWSGVLTAGAFVVTGVLAIVLTWRGVAATTNVAEQLAWLASGGLGAATLAGTGLTILSVQHDRRAEARRRLVLEKATDDAIAALVATVGGR